MACFRVSMRATNTFSGPHGTWGQTWAHGTDHRGTVPVHEGFASRSEHTPDATPSRPPTLCDARSSRRRRTRPSPLNAWPSAHIRRRATPDTGTSETTERVTALGLPLPVAKGVADGGAPRLDPNRARHQATAALSGDRAGPLEARAPRRTDRVSRTGDRITGMVGVLVVCVVWGIVRIRVF